MRTVNLDELGRHFVEGDFALIYKATTYEFQQFVSFEDFQQGCYTYQLGITSMNKLFEKEWCGLTYAMWVDDREEKSIQLAYDAQKQITSFALKPHITDDMDEQWTQNRYRMPICDEWLVFWGGTNELENYHYAYENQRYAYDLVCTEQDATYDGEGRLNEDYFAFGKEIVAPFYGTVVKAVDGFQDNVPGDMDAQNAAGNYVIIAHGHEEYSMIAHLKQDSLVVKEGDEVREGQVLAQCGNSGNSSEPHIHFQVMNSPHFETATSIRIQFQYQLKPVQGDIVKPFPMGKDDKWDLFSTAENSLTISQIVFGIPKIIGRYFTG